MTASTLSPVACACRDEGYMITLRLPGRLSSRCKTFTLGTYVRIECDDEPDFFVVLDMARDRVSGARIDGRDVDPAGCTVRRNVSYVIKCTTGCRLDVLRPASVLPDHGACSYCAERGSAPGCALARRRA